MTIGQIANQVAAFHNKERTDFVDELGEDLVIAALNEARKEIERDYDFFYAQKSAWLSVDPDTGALLSTAKLFDGTPPDGGDTTVKPKSQETFYLYDTTNGDPVLIPVYVDPKRLLAIKTRERSYRYGSARYPSTYQYQNYPLTRYPGTSDTYQQRALKGYFHAGRFFFDPKFDSAKYAVFDGSFWLDDYSADQVIVATAATNSTSITLSEAGPAHFGVGSRLLGTSVASGSGTSWTLVANADTAITYATKTRFIPAYSASGTTHEKYTDWFVENGSDYLKWHAICALNYFVPTFVPRQGGSIAPPEKMRDNAKQSLIEWDSFQWENGRSPNAIR